MKKIDDFRGSYFVATYCRHPEHNPPGHIVLKPGTYEHVCPSCGRKQIVMKEEICKSDTR